MFNSKFTLLIVGILIICLLLVGIFYFQDNFVSDDGLNETAEDVVYIWMEDDNGNIKLVPTTDTHAEGSGSAPG